MAKVEVAKLEMKKMLKLLLAEWMAVQLCGGKGGGNGGVVTGKGDGIAVVAKVEVAEIQMIWMVELLLKELMALQL